MQMLVSLKIITQSLVTNYNLIIPFTSVPPRCLKLITSDITETMVEHVQTSVEECQKCVGVEHGSNTPPSQKCSCFLGKNSSNPHLHVLANQKLRITLSFYIFISGEEVACTSLVLKLLCFTIFPILSGLSPYLYKYRQCKFCQQFSLKKGASSLGFINI